MPDKDRNQGESEPSEDQRGEEQAIEKPDPDLMSTLEKALKGRKDRVDADLTSYLEEAEEAREKNTE